MEKVLQRGTPIYLSTLEQFQQEAASFAETLAPAAGHATLITLSGELGAGKTSFTQGIAQASGISEPITSPTFVLEKIYELPEGNSFARLVHIDAYRLEGERSLTPLGFSELHADPQNLIVLEWPELVASQLPKPDYALILRVKDEGRELIYG
jgi:tRNA threonylcarbamoyladenosine biosynthesis protein TsaE